MNPVPFPSVIDATQRNAYISCARKFYWEFGRSLRPARSNIHLHFGQCLARALEVTRKMFYAEGKSEKESLVAGANALIEHWGHFPTQLDDVPNKSLEACIACLGMYFKQWPLATDVAKPVMTPNGLAVECRLWREIPGVQHPETGEPLRYGGRFDALMSARDAIYVEDDKTTGRIGATWSQQWKLRGQFLGYSFLSAGVGYEPAGVMIRGVCPLKSEVKFAEATVFTPKWQIETWLTQLVRDVKDMIATWQEGYWDQNFGEACTAYGGCPYMTLCETQTPEDWLHPNFEYRPWNPLSETEAQPQSLKPAEANVEQAYTEIF